MDDKLIPLHNKLHNKLYELLSCPEGCCAHVRDICSRVLQESVQEVVQEIYEMGKKARRKK